jgi:serine protease Do
MRFGRLIAAAAIVSAVLAGGLFTLAQAVHGQEGKVVQGKIVHGKSKGKIARAGGEGLTVFDGGRAEIGVAVRDVETADVTRQKLTGAAGAVVDEVRSDTPAAKAGVKAGDVVVGFDGERVRSARQLERLVEETPAGRAVKMAVVRDGAKVDLDITPSASAEPMAFSFATPAHPTDLAVAPRVFERRLERKMAPETATPEMLEQQFRFRGAPVTGFEFDDAPFAMVMGRSRLGVQVEGVDGQLAKYFGVETGALVREVTGDSPAAKAGIKAGDIITAANGAPVKDAGDLREALDSIEDGKAVTLSVTRAGKTLSLPATLEPPEAGHMRTRRIM